MSTSKTPNYLFHSWAGTDYVRRVEFNENFTSIDDLIKALNDRVDGKAPTSHNHSAGDINSGILTIARGGTNNSEFTNNKFLIYNSTTGKIESSGVENSNYASAVHSHNASDITESTTRRFVTDTEKSTWNNKASTSVVTTSVNGLMIASDKVKLNGIATGANNYSHPGSGTNPHGTTKTDVGLSAILNYGMATQAEAIAGTSNVKYMTPLRAKESITANSTTVSGSFTPGATSQTVVLGFKPSFVLLTFAKPDKVFRFLTDVGSIQTYAQMGIENASSYFYLTETGFYAASLKTGAICYYTAIR